MRLSAARGIDPYGDGAERGERSVPDRKGGVTPHDERDAIEKMLSDECPSAATWHRIVTVTAPEEAHKAFQVAREGVLRPPA